MSFQNQGFWMGKGTGCLNDGEMAYDSSSRIEPKRSHQWFMDGPDAELFPNKKQAVEVPNNSLFSGMLSSNVSPWGNTSGFHSISGNFTERLFDSEAARAVHFDDRSISSVTNGKMNVGRKDSEGLFGNESSFGLSMSHTLEDPRSGLSYGGIRKVKVSQVKDSENVMSVSMGHAYNRGDNDTLSASHAYNKADENCISMGLTYNKGEESIISMGATYDRDDNNFISIGQSYNKGEDSISMGQPFKENNDTLPMGHVFGKGDNNTISMSQTFNKADESTLAMGHIYSKGDESTLAMGHIYSKGDENTLAMGHVYSKGDESTISMGQLYKGDESAITIGHIYNKRDEGAISMGHMYSKGDESTISMRHSYNKSDNSLSMGHSYSKGDSSTIISFGGYDDDDDANPSGRLICNYDLLMSQSSVQRTESMSEKELVKSNADLLANNAQIIVSGSDNISKKKEEVKPSKKVPPNNFPSNVRSLLSTGMLDGVPVKYIAWSREKELRGVIKGSGYLCGCQLCNLTKVINAYEFERHAGSKTKHPNNHIYFENGKTIYGIVQELRSTPQNMLFEVIQTITGSPINQKSFRLWKESFLAATRELQRIYGKDEGKQFS